MAWAHRLSGIDPVARTATCAKCGPVRVKRAGVSSHGGARWRCIESARQFRSRNRGYRAARGDVCERCDFEPEHPCQLDVHHVDGDRKNNERANLQTLCANCHRVVTLEQWVNANDPR